MRVAVIGAGAVGSYVTAHLCAAGVETHLLARPASAAVIARDGIRLDGPRGCLEARPASVTADAAQVGPVDLVLLTVKTYDTGQALADAAPLGHATTALASLQNGPDRATAIRDLGWPGKAVDGLCFVSAVALTPGQIIYTSAMSKLVIGRTGSDTLDQRLGSLGRQLLDKGLDLVVSTDIRRDVWSKLVLLSTNFLLCGLARAPAGVIYRDPELLRIALGAMREVQAVGEAAGVSLPADIVESSLRLAHSFPDAMFASMYHDLVAGRRLELREVCGAVARLGARLQVPTPIHDFAIACLAPHANGAPKQEPTL